MPWSQVKTNIVSNAVRGRPDYCDILSGFGSHTGIGGGGVKHPTASCNSLLTAGQFVSIIYTKVIGII